MFWQSAVLIRPGTRTDRGGNTVPDWSPGAVARTTIGRLSIQPTTTAENTDPTRTEVISGWRVFSEPGTAPDVRSGDRLELAGGLVCEVVGEVAAWPDSQPGTHHIEFTLTRVTG